MKPGDVVVLKGRIVEGTDGEVIVKWSAASTNDYLTLIEGKADIGGCILAKDNRGEIHCINPDLFELVWTQEEVVARKMMEEHEVRFEARRMAVQGPIFTDPNIEQHLYDAMTKSLAQSIDDAVLNGMLSTADKKGTKQIRKMLGQGDC